MEEVLKLSVRLRGDLVKKVARWRASGLTLSDIVRQALAVLPDHPNQMRDSKDLPKVKLPDKETLGIRLEDREEALKKLEY